MVTISVREMQHHLAKYLKMVETGEEVRITRRNHPVARIVPDVSDEDVESVSWDDHFAGIDDVFKGRIVKGAPMEEIVSEARGKY